MAVRVAYLGPAGTHTEEALLTDAQGEVQRLPQPTVGDVVTAVEQGHADRGVVPLENSIEGGVGATLDALAAQDQTIRIAGETVLQIRHCLIARPGVGREAIERVLSHPQALGQCAAYLARELPDADRIPAASTAEAVRIVGDCEQPWAALGSRLSASLYGCEVLAEDVQDRDDNMTRFAWLAPTASPATQPPAGEAKTSIIFWGFADESPGALVAVLRELSDRGINLTRIESRPRRVRLGHYMFFADLTGDVADEDVAAALQAVGRRVHNLRVLGSYAAASTLVD